MGGSRFSLENSVFVAEAPSEIETGFEPYGFTPYLIRPQEFPVRLYIAEGGHQDFDLSSGQLLFATYNWMSGYWFDPVVIGDDGKFVIHITNDNMEEEWELDGTTANDVYAAYEAGKRLVISADVAGGDDFESQVLTVVDDRGGLGFIMYFIDGDGGSIKSINVQEVVGCCYMIDEGFYMGSDLKLRIDITAPGFDQYGDDCHQ